VPSSSDIEIEFDRETEDYYIVWEPAVISSGKTKEEALEDLREAAHFGVDTFVDLKLRDIGEGGDTDDREAQTDINNIVMLGGEICREG